MVTSCPACTTTFRVTPEQLKHRNGKVRCGRCRGVFDAFKSLTSMPDVAIGDAPAIATAAATGSAAMRQPSLDMALPVGPLGGASGNPARASRGRRLIWPLAVALLVLLLLLQIAYALRDPLAAAAPALRPLLNAVCQTTGCVIQPPRRSEQLAIESSDLQADPAQPNRIVLTAVVRNRASSLVAHPALELTLTNAQDQALARRVFLPADYLPHPRQAAEGLNGLGEVNVRIDLDTGDLRPAGYRLFLFYP